MSNVQYIGPRIVPKFYVNTLDPNSCDWEAGVGYEPMTVVTYLGDSYTTRKPVPATVGDPAANPEYWAKTGEFNAAILALESRMDTAEDNIDTLQHPYYIFLFDSYGGCTDDGVQLDTLLPENMGLVRDVSYTPLTKSGIGFTMVNNIDTFENVLTANYSRFASIKDKITDIVVLGGANDYTTVAAIGTAIESFCSYARSTYPNAKISIGHISGGRNNRTALDKWQGGNASLLGYQNCSKYGARYLTGVENILHDSYLLQPDLLHPSEAGVAALANQIPNAILGDRAHIHRIVNTTPTFNSAQSWFSAMAITGTIYEQIDDDICRLYMRQGNDITLTISGDFTDSMPATVIATIDRKIMIGDGALAYTIPCLCIVKYGNILLANLSGEIGLDADGNLILAVANGFTYRGNTADFTQADTLIVKTYGSLTLPAQSC